MELLVVTTYDDLSEFNKDKIKQELRRAAIETLCIPPSDSDNISLTIVSNIKENISMSITIRSNEIGQNAGKLLVSFRKRVVEIISQFYKDFTKDNLKKILVQLMMNMTMKKNQNNLFQLNHCIHLTELF